MSQSVSSLRWDDLKLVLAIAREGSLSGAGARLGLNASTLSRRLDGLEEALGVHLFDRTSEGVLPTALSRSMVPAAEAMERAAADALYAIEGRETEPEGSVRITAPPGFASLLIAPALGRLAERYPRLRVDLDASVGYADLTLREADIALRTARPESGDLVTLRVAEEELVPLVGRGLLAPCERVTDLSALRWITWGDDLAHLPCARWLRSQVPEERIVLRTSSVDAQLRAMEAGLGAALHLRSFAAVGDLVPLPLAPALAKTVPPFPRGDIWLVTHRALRQVPRVAVVWDFLIDALAEAQRASAA